VEERTLPKVVTMCERVLEKERGDVLFDIAFMYTGPGGKVHEFSRSGACRIEYETARD